MNNIDPFKIEISDLYPSFTQHLESENNSRILFSGKFGSGKTYFLNEFFQEKKDKYEVFYLYPTKYQISSNQNIIELLKYDILLSLIEREDILKSLDQEKSIIKFIINNFKKKNFITEAVDIINELAIIKILGKPLKLGINIYDKFKDYKNADKNELLDFLKKNNSETDLISQIITNALVRGYNNNKKKNILVIDDLDRIDPEHIFRILNVFSAHLNFDNENETNKFLFDKVILVADYQNLKSIFHHKYGKNTDAGGYFSKFFSTEIFHFSNEEVVENNIKIIIDKFQTQDIDKEVQNSLDNGFLSIFFNEIFINSLYFSGNSKLTLRQLLKGVEDVLSSFYQGEFVKGSMVNSTTSTHQIINIAIKTCLIIFHDENTLIKVLENIRDRENTTLYEYMHKELSIYLINKLVNKNISNDTFTWSHYNIKVENQYISKVKKDGKIVDFKELFYNLLITYIKESKYKKYKPRY